LGNHDYYIFCFVVAKMIEPSALDIAQLKHEMRTMYKNLGFAGSLQVLYEMMVGANTLAEVIVEERGKE
jgi:hypothetical protein